MAKGRLLRGLALACALATTPASAITSAEVPGLPLTVPGTGQPIGVLSRVDGAPPDGTAAARDRAQCLLQRDLVPVPELRRLLKLARKDKPAAYRETTRILEPCMFRKGWQTEFCGADGQPECRMASPDEGHDEPQD